jgi:hypothetical protein
LLKEADPLRSEEHPFAIGGDKAYPDLERPDGWKSIVSMNLTPHEMVCINFLLKKRAGHCKVLHIRTHEKFWKFCQMFSIFKGVERKQESSHMFAASRVAAHILSSKAHARQMILNVTLYQCVCCFL